MLAQALRKYVKILKLHVILEGGKEIYYFCVYFFGFCIFIKCDLKISYFMYKHISFYTVFQRSLFLRITTIYMKTQCLQTNKAQHYWERKMGKSSAN